MKRICLYLLLFFLAAPAFATSIVIFVTPQYIILAADSKRIFLDSQFRTTADQTVCKIRSVNNYCFVLAGYVASLSTSFSADRIIARHLETKSSYEDAVTALEQEMIMALKKEILFQKNHQPEVFRKLSASGEHLLEVALLRMANGQPQVQVIGFRLTDKENIEVSSYTSRCPGDCPQEQPQLYFLGEYSGMEAHLQRQDGFSNPIQLVEELISVQATATPSSVGRPVNIVKFSAGGIEWVQ